MFNEFTYEELGMINGVALSEMMKIKKSFAESKGLLQWSDFESMSFHYQVWKNIHLRIEKIFNRKTGKADV